MSATETATMLSVGLSVDLSCLGDCFTKYKPSRPMAITDHEWRTRCFGYLHDMSPSTTTTTIISTTTITVTTTTAAAAATDTTTLPLP